MDFPVKDIQLLRKVFNIFSIPRNGTTNCSPDRCQLRQIRGECYLTRLHQVFSDSPFCLLAFATRPDDHPTTAPHARVVLLSSADDKHNIDNKIPTYTANFMNNIFTSRNSFHHASEARRPINYSCRVYEFGARHCRCHTWPIRCRGLNACQVLTWRRDCLTMRPRRSERGQSPENRRQVWYLILLARHDLSPWRQFFGLLHTAFE